MEEEKKQQNAINSTCLIVIGMAGSGKTTFLKELYSQVSSNKNFTSPPYLINLDPAVQFIPYTPYLDIRKFVEYKKVMKEHGLGPNGAIITSLNLFSAQFQVVLQEIEDTKSSTELFVVDTPGQIEVFSWSASGNIISQTLAATLPTTLVYIIDAVRCQNPNVFMSNMLFCCSIFYKMKLPMIVVLNKSDKADTQKLINWMKNYEEFLKDIEKEDNYLSTLSRSMCLSLDEFYENLNVVSLSSATGEGFDELLKAVDIARTEYNDAQTLQFYSSLCQKHNYFQRIFLPDLQQNKQKFEMIEKKKIDEELMKFTKQVNNISLNTDNNKTVSNQFFQGEKVNFPISEEEEQHEEDKKY